jgi:hypothetical protein
VGDFQRGDLVAYQSHGGAVSEVGTVMSINQRYVFVRFGADEHSKACAPHMLTRALVVPAPEVECCASGRCEVCSPGFDWGRDG